MKCFEIVSEYVPAPSEALPHIDEHSTVVDADLDTTWAACLRTVDGSFRPVGRTARLLGCEDTAASGPRPLATGSTLPGFHVQAAEPGQTLALVGNHRFSSYALIFRLEETGGGTTTVRAETRAAFPGVKGGIYKTLVIRTRGHVLVTRRLLAAVKQRAERA
jgi:hypothetical protein